MATSYAARNAAAKLQGYKSLYDMRKAQMAATAAQSVAPAAAEVLPQVGQLALPAAGQTAQAAANGVNPGLLQDVLSRMGQPGAPGPTMGAIPQAMANPQLSALASQSAHATPSTLMNIAERTAAATPGPGHGTIMGALNPGPSIPQPLALGAGPTAEAGYGSGIFSGGAGAGNLRTAANIAETGASKAPWATWGLGAGEEGAGRALAVGGLKGALGAGSMAIAGLTAGGLADSMNVGGENSNWDRGLSGGLRGAGIGAAAGSVIPVIGTALGAGIGGAAGAAINIFGPKGKSKPDQFDSELAKQTNTLAQIANAYGLDPATQAELMKSFQTDAQVAKITGGKAPDKAILAQQVAAYASQIPTVQKQKAQLSQNGYDGIAMGNAIRSYIDPLMAKSAATQDVSAKYYQGLADKYSTQSGGSIGAGYGAMAQNARNYSATSNADWAKAMSLQPTVAALALAQKQAALPAPGFQSVFAPATPALV